MTTALTLQVLSANDNRFSGGGTEPDSEPLAMLQQAAGQAIPDVVWDGTLVPGKTAAEILCLENNDGEGFVNLDAMNAFAAPSFDASEHRCSMEPLSEILLSAGND